LALGIAAFALARALWPTSRRRADEAREPRAPYHDD
jgi:hypothetical protein